MVVGSLEAAFSPGNGDWKTCPGKEEKDIARLNRVELGFSLLNLKGVAFRVLPPPMPKPSRMPALGRSSSA